jgi:hypothetical protein
MLLPIAMVCWLSKETYWGRWERQSAFFIGPDRGSFILKIEPSELNVSGSLSLSAVLKVFQSSSSRFNRDFLPLDGVSFRNDSFYLLCDAHSYPRKVLYEAFSPLNYVNHTSKNFSTHLARFNLRFRHIMLLNRWTAQGDGNPFHLSHSMKGALMSIDTNLTLMGWEMNETLFNREARLFGGVSGSCLSLILLLNRHLSFHNEPGISMICLAMISSYDFGYAGAVYRAGWLSPDVYGLFSLVFVTYCALYVWYGYRRQLTAWRNQINERLAGTDGDMLDLRHRFFLFVLGTMSMNCVFVVLFGELNRYPFAAVFIAFSCWIPQIAKLVQTGEKRGIPLWFVVSLTFVRLSEIGFALGYPKSVLFNPPNCGPPIMATVWSLLQIAILVLQRCYGGRFFLSQQRQLRAFDYYAAQPPEGQECCICLNVIEAQAMAAVAPCGHAFHDHFLRRWVEERLVCPYCRRPIPPMRPQEDLV